ncbi:28763_t:CDS:2 [Dentiscutata erythropus]|uniref:28763_t:CDS:1 n=1 Tax=Dentiscutata erythropus TaxID=1348616 RepID=A0A9N9HZM9_9GLOM|nr:28763_t:CDS:2 [Dentiscutata erythropus]
MAAFLLFTLPQINPVPFNNWHNYILPTHPCLSSRWWMMPGSVKGDNHV